MTILLSGNSITPAQLASASKVVKAESGWQQLADAGELSVMEELEENAVFNLAPYLGQLTENNEQTRLPELPENMPERPTGSDMPDTVPRGVRAETLVSSPLTELVNVSATLKVDFVAPAASTVDTGTGLAEPLVIDSPDTAVSAGQVLPLSSDDMLVVSQSVATKAVNDTDGKPIDERIIEGGKLLDSEIANIASELVVGVLGDSVESAVETLNVMSAAKATPLLDTFPLSERQVEHSILPAKVTNNGQLATATPLLASLQLHTNSMNPLAPSKPVLAGVAPILGAGPGAPAVADELVNSNSFSSAIMPPLKQHTGLAEQLSLQQFLHQQSVVIAPASSSQFSTAPNSLATPTTSLPQWQSLSLSGAPASWGPKLFAVLSDKVVLQMGQQVQRAQIRLDPPQLGNIELRIAVEGEKTTIQLFATNPQVREAMQQTLELLRVNLSMQLGASNSVDVQLGDQAQQQRAFFADEVAVSQQAELVTTEQQLDSTQQQQQLGWLNRLA